MVPERDRALNWQALYAGVGIPVLLLLTGIGLVFFDRGQNAYEREGHRPAE